MNWIYKNKEIKTIKDVPKDKTFMVYQITFNDNTYYIGSQQVYSKFSTRLSKKRANELYSGKGRKPVKEEKIVEKKGWQEYCSSSKLVQERCSKESYKKEILAFYSTKTEMLLQEAYLIIKSFLEKDEQILNSWINIKSPKIK